MRAADRADRSRAVLGDSGAAIVAPSTSPEPAQGPAWTLVVPPRSERGESVTGFDPRAIELLHRGHDGLVTFHRKPRIRPQAPGVASLLNLGGVHPQDLDLPALRPRLGPGGSPGQAAPDIYFSINGFYRRRNARAAPGGIVPYHSGMRSTDSARWLTACFVDLDIYRARLEEAFVIQRVLEMQGRGALPRWSMLARSGRGLWLFWLLVAPEETDYERAGGPVRAWPETVQAWNGMQAAICRRLAPLGADSRASDFARITRVPGSINPKSGRRVLYEFETDEEGGVPAYTLTQMAAASAVRLEPTHYRAPQTGDSSYRARGKKGHRIRFELLAERLTELERLRGGLREGHRNNAAWIKASALQRLRRSPAEIRSETERLGANCKPPLSAGEIRRAFERRDPLERIRNQTVADWLVVTEEESRATGLLCASCFRPEVEPEPERQTRAGRREARRQALRRILDSPPGTVPPLRRLQARLEEQGLGAALRTVRRDLEALGVSNPRSRHPAPPTE